MKRLIIAAGMAVLIMLTGLAGSASASQDKVTICHAAGLEGTTQFVTLTIAAPAVYGEAGHFYENGTPRAGHEQDYMGPCLTDESPSPTTSPTSSPEPSSSPQSTPSATPPAPTPTPPPSSSSTPTPTTTPSPSSPASGRPTVTMPPTDTASTAGTTSADATLWMYVFIGSVALGLGALSYRFRRS